MTKIKPLIFLHVLVCWALFNSVYAQTPYYQAIQHHFPPPVIQGGIYNPYLSVSDSVGLATANNLGLLLYDGSTWERVDLPNGTQCKSVFATNHGIYTGGQGFVGKYAAQPDEQGRHWTDFTGRVQEVSGMFDDVWRMFGQKRGDSSQVIFSTNAFIGMINQAGEYSEWLKAPIKNAVSIEIGIAVHSNDTIYIFGSKGQINHAFHAPSDTRMEGLVWDQPGRPLLLTHRSGTFRWNGNEWIQEHSSLSDALQKVRVNCLLKNSDHWLIGTSENGILITYDFESYQEGYNTSSGLLSNTVLDMKLDGKGNCWIGLEGGVELLRQSWPHRIPHGLKNESMVGYSSLHLPTGEIYWGTSQALYYQENPTAPLLELSGVDGPIWALKNCEGTVFVFHPNGFGSLQKTQYTPIFSGIGCWNIWESSDPERWLVGTYEGFLSLSKSSVENPEKSTWIVNGFVKGFAESSRFMAQNGDGSWWVSHPYRGAYRLIMDEKHERVIEQQLFGEDSGFPVPLQVNLCAIENEIRFATQSGFYRFNETSLRMEPDSSSLNDWINPEGSFERLFEDSKGGLWVFEGTEISHIPLGGAALLADRNVGFAPMQQTRPIAPFETIEFMPNGMACVPVENGFVYLDPERMLLRDSAPRVQILSALHLNDTGIERSLSPDHSELEAGVHSIEFRLNGFNSNWSGIQKYQWRINGGTELWSNPSESPVINLAGLRPGNHRIEFRSHVHQNLVGPSAVSSLRIAPFWFQRPITQVGLALSVLTVFFMFLRRSKRILQAEHRLERELQSRSQRDAERNLQASIQESEEALRMERENVREQLLASKNQELASVTMNLVQKAQLLQSLEAGLSSLSSTPISSQQREINKLLNTIREGGKLDDAWEQFTDQFDQVHVEFQKRVTEQFPNLTKNDLKLCTYLRMNLSSKEMASLMFVSVRAIEVSRSRLRARLGIASGQNLIQFIQNI